VPESHPRVLAGDYALAGVGIVNDAISGADLVLALGCKFSHNSTAGFQLRIDPAKLIHVDASASVLNANYPASLAIESDVQKALIQLGDGAATEDGTGWTAEAIESYRSRLDAAVIESMQIAPKLPAEAGTDWPGFFRILSDAFGPELVLVPDSGMHQMITRAFARIQWAGGILSPIDFQSMGFGLPASIGALAANPRRPVAAIIGDGGLVMTAPELLTAVREKLPLTVIVFNDGQYNLIRLQQLSAFGKAHGAEVTPMDYDALCRALGVTYYRLDRDAGSVVGDIANDTGVRLLEVPLTDPGSVRSSAIKGQLKATARRHLSEGQLSWFQQLLRRRGGD
jgi:acetolactate synthase-1/2/3 large subunit